jgi:hypothetical protein
MSTTGVADGAITLIDDNLIDELDLYVGSKPETKPARFTPSLLTLVRFTTATDEPAGRPDRPASRAPGDAPSFRKTTELVRFLALVAGRHTTSGLALDLPVRLLDLEFGRGRVARFEDVDFPAALTHEPTCRFLRETGLPEHASPFHMDTDGTLWTLGEYYADEQPDDFPEDRLPDGAAALIRLGDLAEGESFVVDGTTGAILSWNEPEATLTPLTTDVSTLALTLWMLHREHAADRGALLKAVAGIDPA